ncbi:MAG: glycosyltransferase [Candidatus Bathyarchaeia archaeon]|jgi:glycosyltransferase involved in cell wall biosynthesis
MGTNVSVLLTIRNAEKDIGLCLTSLLNQTFSDFEIVIIDDVSNDKTKEIIEKFEDPRVRYFRNERWLGLSASRNKCLKYATGDYVFFTDGDCLASKNWIEEGLKYLKTSDCIGVEGKTYYVSKEYKPTRSDDVVDNITGGQYPTCNMVYVKSVLNDIGGFDERYTYMEDRDLALRAKRLGKIRFNPNMIVYHQKKTLTSREFVRKAAIVRNRVLIYKKLHDKSFFTWRILYPMNLVAIFFPPLIIRSFFSNRYKTKEDFALFPFTYIRLIYERLIFWDMCAREKVFLI